MPVFKSTSPLGTRKAQLSLRFFVNSGLLPVLLIQIGLLAREGDNQQFTTLLDAFVFDAATKDDPDSGKSMRQLVENKGYPFEEHRIVTADGYVLITHRIPHGRQTPFIQETNKKVVFLPAPLFCSSTFYVDDLANNSIGYIFADQGFDVWLGNTRGNAFGMETLNRGRVQSVKDKEFYNYTLVEHGIFDVAAQIDYILQVTGAKNVSYFGHSQGAASGFALLSKRPAYNSKISALASLGGFRTFGCNFDDPFLKSLWRSVKAFVKTMRQFTEEFGWSTINQLCRSNWPACRHLLTTVIYGDDNHSNITRIPIYLEHYPQSSSMKNLIYYTQMQEVACLGEKRVFEFNYDELFYGDEVLLHDPAVQFYGHNQEVYGDIRPPVLSTENIRVPVKVYYSDGDTLITTNNQKALIASLPNVVGEYHIRDKGFVHGSFAHSPYNMTHVYDTIQFFNEFFL